MIKCASPANEFLFQTDLLHSRLDTRYSGPNNLISNFFVHAEASSLAGIYYRFCMHARICMHSIYCIVCRMDVELCIVHAHMTEGSSSTPDKLSKFV